MALRVLLADNSETIKKAIQLTLQDYAIDLRVVNLGVDVLDVATSFKPDIIFVDILLQKKSGYDVSKEIKTHPQLKNTPVVLMWSGFMEFDEQKAKESLADFRLEKPFDAQTLRNAVQKLTAKTKNNTLGAFLDFPDLPPEEKATPAQMGAKPSSASRADPLKELEKIKTEAQKFSAPTTKPVPTPINPNSFKLDEIPTIDLEEANAEEFGEEDFKMQNLSKPEKEEASNTDDELTKSFVLNIPDDFSPDDSPADFDKMESIQDMSFLLNPNDAKASQPTAKPKAENVAPPQQQRSEPRTPAPKPAALTSSTKTNANTPNAQELEKMVREQVSEVLEKIAWQVVPEVAAEIIRKELERLLKDNDSKI